MEQDSGAVGVMTELPDTETDDAEAEAPAGMLEGGPAQPQRGVTLLAASVVCVVVVLLAGAFVLTWTQLQSKNDRISAQNSALVAARQYAVWLASYSYHSLDQSFGQVMQHSTPSFAKQYTSSTSALKSVLVKYEVTAKATVVAAGVESSSTNHASVLVFFNRTVTNALQSKSTNDQSSISLSLVHSGKGWLIDNVVIP